ncbi:Single-stranded TG1-3 DNA-binding protein [Neolecta irregularis DAH-3]|uniref:Single-stranded TG1-3 DNA-binding protein n=1 Tax=Neolecta irregularis (strain DAH-3) TaxID=1198029 RepID=A0A1U7LNT5_NEOID|nr:Single-stranded TG1-3 DNA-binding protein [Neolecta irregularis DAH-3]|eukprot:OLL24288.1 Single-stranded TG1-3 DNA-binding protein [Neolecta irregularis DAH-3]
MSAEQQKQEQTAYGGDDAKSSPVQTEEAPPKHRLFIGNLAFKTTEDDLRGLFEGFELLSISLPSRPFGRPAGYAFIEFKDEASADEAAIKFHGKELQGRNVSIQKARPPEKSKDNDAARVRGRFRGRGRAQKVNIFQPNRARGVKNGEENTAAQDGDKAALIETTNRTSNLETNGESSNEVKSSTKKPSVRKPVVRVRRQGPPADGVASTTTLFVANLPYDFTEEQLKQVFFAYKPASAHIVPRQIPIFVQKKLAARGEARKGRGFAFVTLENEEMQKKALAELNGKEVSGREITVKIAFDRAVKEGENDAEKADKENMTASAPAAANQA